MYTLSKAIGKLQLALVQVARFLFGIGQRAIGTRHKRHIMALGEKVHQLVLQLDGVRLLRKITLTNDDHLGQLKNHQRYERKNYFLSGLCQCLLTVLSSTVK
jgi:hypothetical protein